MNLIPLNPTPGYPTPGHAADAGAPSSATGSTTLGVNATVRRNRGTDIDAACGQLAASRQIAPPTRKRRAVSADEDRHGVVGPDGVDQMLAPADRAPGHSTDRSSVPATSAPAPTTGAPPLAARLAAR